MASTRATEVAEALWELKRADKVATFSAIAQRAGFSAGANGRAMATCIKTIRRDWPHLQWWRAISDDGSVEKGSVQEEKLLELGLAIDESKSNKKQVKVHVDEARLMDWAGASEASP
jgi:alkylated DNA nucleotide flippase Atl1